MLQVLVAPLVAAGAKVGILMGKTNPDAAPHAQQSQVLVPMDTPGIKVLEGTENRVVFLGMDQGRDELLYSSVKGRNPLKDRRVRIQAQPAGLGQRYGGADHEEEDHQGDQDHLRSIFSQHSTNPRAKV